MKKRIYISGMRGDGEAFENTEALLRDMGAVPISPRTNGLPADAPPKAHFMRNMELLWQSDAIYMMREWQKSREASTEAFVAEQIIGLHYLSWKMPMKDLRNYIEQTPTL
ncbi:MAG: DUF4406 domain-containing protein [Paludibacteraceae bacterium]